jgi:hypothetical protein
MLPGSISTALSTVKVRSNVEIVEAVAPAAVKVRLSWISAYGWASLSRWPGTKPPLADVAPTGAVARLASAVELAE